MCFEPEINTSFSYLLCPNLPSLWEPENRSIRHRKTKYQRFHFSVILLMLLSDTYISYCWVSITEIRGMREAHIISAAQPQAMSSLIPTCPAPKGRYPSTPSWRDDRPQMCPWFHHHRWPPVPGQAGPQNALWQLTHRFWLRTTSAILGCFLVFGPPIATGKASRLSATGRRALTQQEADPKNSN